VEVNHCTPNSGEIAERQILNTEIVKLNIHKNRSVRHRFKDELLVNPAAVSDFKMALRRKHTMRLSEDSALLTKAYKHFTTK
jgi:hypothetical protein